MTAALQEVAGVKNVEVSFDKKEAYADIDPKTDVNTLVAAVKSRGYDASLKQWGRP